MKFLNLILLFLLPNILLAQDLADSYTLNEQAATSAGVYDADGNLIRTLWSNIIQEAGTYDAPL